ncbi:hypothetical protein ACFL6X_00630 [Candidatus Latescibacterota bacterium]
MPREFVATATEQVAFREYESAPLAEGQVRVRSRYGAAKHGTEMAVYAERQAGSALLLR